MAHEIHENDTVLTVGARAWHGLDINQMSADLNEVKRIVFPWEPAELPLVAYHPLTGMPIPSGHKKIYRMVNQSIENPGGDYYELGEVGTGYQLLTNSQMIDHVKPIFETGLLAVETAGSLFNGRKTWIMGKLTEYEPVPGDTRLGYVAFFNSHDGSTRAGWICTEVRIVCDNTRRLAMQSGVSKVLSVKHTSGLTVNLEKIRDAINLLHGGFSATQEQLKELARITISTEDQIKKIVKVAFSAAHGLLA